MLVVVPIIESKTPNAARTESIYHLRLSQARTKKSRHNKINWKYNSTKGDDLTPSKSSTLYGIGAANAKSWQ